MYYVLLCVIFGMKPLFPAIKDAIQHIQGPCEVIVSPAVLETQETSYVATNYEVEKEKNTASQIVLVHGTVVLSACGYVRFAFSRSRVP